MRYFVKPSLSFVSFVFQNPTALRELFQRHFLKRKEHYDRYGHRKGIAFLPRTRVA